MIRPFSLTVLSAILAFVPLAIAQNNGNTQAAVGNTGSVTTGSAGPLSGTNPSLAHTIGSGQVRPIFISGDVLFDDGTSPNNQIRIERFCSSGGVHVETHTDSKGHFSFQVGGEQGNNISDADYSGTTFGGRGNGLSAASSSSGVGHLQSLMGCELRAAYPGYVSEKADLSLHSELSDPKVGTLVLHRMTEVKGTTISGTSAQAPKSAQKSFEKGAQLAQTGRFAEAEPHFAKATAEYPKYAEAWVALGEVQEHLNKQGDAKSSFLNAIGADNRYVSPYDRLARLFATQKNWQEAANYSRQATDLNPVEFPSSFWYNALASYNLKNNTEAEKSARALIKLDSQHRYPDAETMLAEFAANRGELSEAADHLRTFLTEAPNAKNADLMKRQLARIEAAQATQAKGSVPK